MKEQHDIFRAIEENDTTDVKCLLETGADVNAKDKWGNTPLHRACYHGHVELAQLLLSHGADVNARDTAGYTPLHEACLYLESDIARLLLSHGADVNARDDRDYTPLHTACQFGNATTVELLLERGADPKAKNNSGRMPLDLVIGRQAGDLPREHREEILDLFRQYAPEMVMEAFCTMEMRP